jgi:conjugative transfer signal peptidase TraF
MPRGLYWRSPVKTLQRGNMVAACIPQKFAEYALHAGYLPDGPCVGGASAVLKYVAAISGDDVTLTPQGVFVNGNRLPGSTPLTHDDQNRAIPHVPFGAYHLTSEETWLYSPKPRSFDARYYGPINVINVQASVRPVITEP